jgi:hypothetical protein
MTSDRPYQPALPTSVAVAEIRRCAGTQFDPEVAAAMTRIFGRPDGFHHPAVPAATPLDSAALLLEDGLPDPFEESVEPSLVRFRQPPA